MTKDQFDAFMALFEESFVSSTEESPVDGDALTLVDGIFAIAKALGRIASVLERRELE